MDKIQIKALRGKFSAIGTESRIEIVLLCQDKELTITELSKKLNMSHNNTSQNVSILEKEGFVRKTRHKDNTVTVKSIAEITKDGVKW